MQDPYPPQPPYDPAAQSYVYNPYAFEQPRPGAVIAFWVLCGLMIASGFFSLVFGLFFALVDPSTFSPNQQSMPQGDRIMAAIVYIVMGVVLISFYTIAFFLPRRPWAWVVNLILLALSLPGCCLLSPLSITTIVFWCMAPTRQWYGMQVAVAYPPMPTYGQPPESPENYYTQYPQSQQPPEAPPPQEPWRDQ